MKTINQKRLNLILIVAILAVSLLSIVACQKKKSALSEHSTGSSVVTSSTKTKASSTAQGSIASSSGSVVTDTTQTTEGQSNLSKQSNQAQDKVNTSEQADESSQENSSTNASKLQSQFDYTAFGKGDYSSLAGAWTNDLGETLTITADGQVTQSTDNKTFQLSSTGQSNGYYYLGLQSSEQQAGGAGVMILPAGIKEPYEGKQFDQDCFAVGHDWQDLDHAYFKQ